MEGGESGWWGSRDGGVVVQGVVGSRGGGVPGVGYRGGGCHGSKLMITHTTNLKFSPWHVYSDP